MNRLRALFANASGTAAMEFALAVPVLISMIWGMFQIGMLFEANAGVQNALGEGARYATICVNPTPSGCSQPTDTEITAKIVAHKFGLGNGTWATPTIVTDATANTKLITVSYSQPTNFLFFAGPDVTITKSKLVYYSV